MNYTGHSQFIPCFIHNILNVVLRSIPQKPDLIELKKLTVQKKDGTNNNN